MEVQAPDPALPKGWPGLDGRGGNTGSTPPRPELSTDVRVNC